jgi:hypothetical protein
MWIDAYQSQYELCSGSTATYLAQGTLSSSAVDDGDLELAIVTFCASSRGRSCRSDISSNPLGSRIGNCSEGSESESDLHVYSE